MRAQTSWHFRVPHHLPFHLLSRRPLTCSFKNEEAALEKNAEQFGYSRAGVMTSDPRKVVHAVPIPLLTFEEATELAFFGAAVLHPLAMQPALQNGNLNVRVKNSYNRYTHQRAHVRILVRNCTLHCRISVCHSWVTFHT